MATPLLLAQQVFSALTNNAATSNLGCFNQTSGNGTYAQTPEDASTLPSNLTSLITFLISFSALRDWLKLIILGGFIETSRRFAFHLFHMVYNSFFVTATFEDEDASYYWMILWLSKQPSWKKARDVQVSTQSLGIDSSAIMVEGEEEDASNALGNSRPLTYLPSTHSVQHLWYKKRWMRVSRSFYDVTYGRRSVLEICILSWDQQILNQLLLEAKKAHREAQQHSISIYISDSTNNWKLIASRPKRPLDSVVLDPGIKDLLVDDARDFLASKSWYLARGIPFRRGYLLYGAPGTGKTSIIHSLAGELGLDVYVVSLSRVGLDDTALNELISDLPEKCIALMEDIDAAFSHTVNRDETEGETGKPDLQKQEKGPKPSASSRISLSGLLNALDGVAAQEGRILFATTNKYTSLDSALCRPGRMDLHIEFKLASKHQAGELYRCFYLPDSPDSPETGEEEKAKKDSPDSGYASGSDEKATPLPSPSSSSFNASTSPLSDAVTYHGNSHRRRAPRLSQAKINTLAAEFAASIPEREFSMAALQGYLMAYKIRPFEAVTDAVGWVESQRAEMAKKEKERATPATPATPARDHLKEIKLDEEKFVGNPALMKEEKKDEEGS